jgi:hypothetical protein
MPAIHLVILLSIGTFQASIPSVSKQATPSFADSDQGAETFTTWAKAAIPSPKFGQPPLQICVVGAVPKPLWESAPPFHSLEPYSATFHYVEQAKGMKATAPRTMREALRICASTTKKKT